MTKINVLTEINHANKKFQFKKKWDLEQNLALEAHGEFDSDNLLNFKVTCQIVIRPFHCILKTNLAQKGLIAKVKIQGK